MRTEQAGLADINQYYDPALSLEENLARVFNLLNTDSKSDDSGSYYSGGMIQDTDLTNEIERLLRGY